MKHLVLLIVSALLAAVVPARGEGSGAWVLTGVRVAKPEIPPNPCYPGKSIELSDGSAVFVQGYADCTGEQRVKGGEKARTAIKWRFSPGAPRLQPGEPLSVHVSIDRDSSPVPYYGGGAVYFYFRSQSAVGGLELKGFLADPAFARSAERDLRLDRVPSGSDGEKLTMWLNVSGESGIGDVFYEYEFRSKNSGPSSDDNLVTCRQYARLAIAEQDENERRGCGFKGSEWHKQSDAHFNWCMEAGREAANEAHDRRMTMLAHCNPTDQGAIGNAPVKNMSGGYQLFFNGQLVSGPDAANYTRQQAIDNCRWNKKTKPAIRVTCSFEGEPIEGAVGNTPANNSSGEAPNAFWAVGEGADGVKLGVIAPDYSPTEYVGVVFYCVRRGGVRVSVDSPTKLKAGARVKVRIEADGASANYRGKVEDKATEEGSAVIFETTYNDPLFEDLSGAAAIRIMVDGKMVAIPTRNNKKAFKEFFERCRR